MIIKIIAAYYLITDQWSQEYKGGNIKILEGSDDTKIVKTWTGHQNILGCQVITKGNFTWKIRVNKFKYKPNYWHILVGVVNMDKVDIKYLIKETFPSELGCYTFDTTDGQILNQDDLGGVFEKSNKSGWCNGCYIGFRESNSSLWS